MLALDRVRRLVNERRFALGVQLIDRRRDPLEVTEGYAARCRRRAARARRAATGGVRAAHGDFRDGELLVLGLGRFGGHSLTHASDLDIIYLHTADQDGAVRRRQAARSKRLFQPACQPGHRGAQRPNRRRPALRRRHPAAPGGRQGHAGRLARCASNAISASRPGRGSIWRLCRARPLFGSDDGKARVAAAIDGVLRMPRDSAKVAADAAKMRAEIARHKPPREPLDVKLGPGGLVDLEFATHVLQLTRHVGLDHAARSGARRSSRPNLWLTQTLSMR